MRKFRVQHYLQFIGPYRGEEIYRIDEISDMHGIYAAFTCRLTPNNTIVYTKIVYIGKAEGTNSLQKRIMEHIRDDQVNWEQSYCESDEFIVYCWAYCEENISDIEAALIYKNQPKANIQGKTKYLGKAWFISVDCTGEKGLLCNPCWVNRWISF